MSEHKGVFTFAQQVEGVLTPVSLELVGKAGDLAKELGTDVTAVLLGENIQELATTLVEYGADRVIVVDSHKLKYYSTEPYTQALDHVMREYKPEVFLIGGKNSHRSCCGLY